jgi:hypothetical protein
VSLIPDPLLFALRRVNVVLVVAESLRRQVGLAFVPERPAAQLLCNRSILTNVITTSSARARGGQICSLDHRTPIGCEQGRRAVKASL